MADKKTFFRAGSGYRRPTVLLALAWYSVAIHRGIAQYARQANWALDITMTRNGQMPVNWKGDGIIGCLGMSDKVDALIEKAGLPTVNIGNTPHPRIPRVVSDNAAVGRMAADYFLQRGFRNFAFFLWAGAPGENERMKAYARRIRMEGRPVAKLDWGAVSRARGYNPMQKKTEVAAWLISELARLPKPLAVMAEFDDLAVEVLDACVIGNISVPGQVAVLGVDNDPLRCEFTSIPLSSVDDDQERIGYEAGALLNRLMKGARPPRRPLLIPPLGVITRQSSDIYALPHSVTRLGRALVLAQKEIAESLEFGCDFAAIAQRLNMSYSHFRREFKKEIGLSPGEYLHQVRVRRAQELLDSTSLSLKEIAEKLAYHSAFHFSKDFKARMGQSPSNWRKARKQLF